MEYMIFFTIFFYIPNIRFSEAYIDDHRDVKIYRQ